MARNTSDVMLSRVGHVSVSVFDNRLLLIWGGYVVGSLDVAFIINLLLQFRKYHFK